MPGSYKIIVRNHTGGTQNYSFFSAPPTVSGASSGKVWSAIMKSSRNVPNGASVSFEFSSNYYAFCGSSQGSLQHGSSISISKTMPVTLGHKQGSGVELGSTVNLVVYEGSYADLAPPNDSGHGKVGNFQLDTSCQPGSQFTIQDARDNNLLVGVATARDGDMSIPIGAFNPYPNAKYQIMPQSTYFVACGDRFEAGQVVQPEMIGNTIAVDFNARGTNNVTLIHNDSMQYEFA
ncbi:hypothetical protein F66182_7152 [Fusarium sp. NRRL 66182]|nr:hypothetical protein F66182_7152 [Fusarium sp. NRRL 66182]